jgi:dipeptidyl aminopeptidase/acylaminoacyl peptidase
MSGGDAVAITTAEEGVSRFAWSPDGKQIAFAATEPKSKALKDREAEDGDIQLVGEDHRMTHLWVIDVDSRKSRQITCGAFNVGSFRWSPDGARIAFDHTINGDLGADSTADIAVVTVADGGVRQVVTQPGPDVNPYWSADGQSIAFETTMNAPWHYYANTMIAVVAADGGTPVPLTRDFDEDVSIVDWTRDGIWFAAPQRTATALFHLDPGSRRIERHTPAADWVGGAFSLDRSGAQVAFVWSDPRHYPEIGVAPTTTMQVKTLTRLGDQLKGWPLGTTEVVRWTSRDGAAIEGVLHKPAGWTAGKRRPLMVVIHGGPKISRVVKSERSMRAMRALGMSLMNSQRPS